MKNLENVKPLGLNEDQIMDLLNLYQFKGKDYYYDNLLKGDSEAILRKTIKSDILAIADILKLDITDPRKKLLLKKDCEPKNKDEQFFINIKNTLVRFMGFYRETELVSQEFQNLANSLFDKIENVKYRTYRAKGETTGFLESTKLESMRNELSKIQCPTFIVSGSDDKTVGNDAPKEFSQSISDAKVYIYEGLGHGTFTEAKDFYDRILAFLKK